MKKLRFLKVSMSMAALALLAVFGLAGCGGGGGSSNTGNTGSGSSTVQPISTSGQITTPSSIEAATLKVVAGMDSQPVSSNGSFALNLNKDNTQLVMAVNNENNPILMAIAVNAQAGDTVSLSAQSTGLL